jgi:hypothetical protein
VGNFTIISDGARTVPAAVTGGRVTIDTGVLPAALGWELKPQGLCRDDVCVPVRDQAALFGDGDRLDISAVANALGRAIVVDEDAGLAAVALPNELRAQAIEHLTAPPFTLPDLDGTPHHFAEWHGTKRLLVAFASW